MISSSLFEIFSRYIADHWILSTYFSTMILNENAILTAFSLSAAAWREKYFLIGMASIAGALTNDVLLYGVARFGLMRFFQKKPLEEEVAQSLFEKIFLKNIFLSLFFMKFLFGLRTFLTLYIIYRKEIPFKTYLVYNFLGVFFYVSVLAFFGWLIGIGMGSSLDTYHMIVRVVTFVLIFSFFTHIISLVIRAFVRRRYIHS